jgi:hypothetical protein
LGVSAEGPGGEAPLITPVAAVLMVVVGVFAFCALLVLFTYASALEGGDNGGGHALSKSAIGFAGLAKGLKDIGEPVLVSRHRLPSGRAAGLFVETPPATAKDDDVDNLGFEGPVLAILPKWQTAPDPRHRGWVLGGGLLNPKLFGKDSLFERADPSRRTGVTRPVLVARSGPFAPGQRIALGPINALQTFDLTGWKDWTPVLVDERGGVVLARGGTEYLLSDPDLMNNRGLKDFTTFAGATTIVNALRAENGPVIFDVTLNGLGRQRSALSLMFDPPFLAVTLCLATAAALAGFQAFCRFGPVRRPTRALALGKGALADNTAALVRLAGREGAMGAPYAVLTRELAAKAVGAPRDLAPDALTAFLDRLGAQRGAADTLGSLTLLAGAAPDRARLEAVARKLYHWRGEMTGES